MTSCNRLLGPGPQSKCWGKVRIQQCGGIQLYYRQAEPHKPWGMQFYEGLYNQQWTSVSTINELQFPECLYPQSWKGLEWHLLNPGAQILAAAQSSEFSTGVKHHNKCSLSDFKGRLCELRNRTERTHLCHLIQLSSPRCHCLNLISHCTTTQLMLRQT